MPFTLATYRSTAQGHTSAGPRTFLGQTEGNTRYEDQQQQQQQQLSLACLLSSGCQCQRVPFESFIPASLLEAHHHAGRRILPRGYPPGSGFPFAFPFLFPISNSDSWCHLRCTAGANRRHLTLTFRSPLPSKEFASGLRGQKRNGKTLSKIKTAPEFWAGPLGKKHLWLVSIVKILALRRILKDARGNILSN